MWLLRYTVVVRSPLVTSMAVPTMLLLRVQRLIAQEGARELQLQAQPPTGRYSRSARAEMLHEVADSSRRPAFPPFQQLDFDRLVLLRPVRTIKQDRTGSPGP